ncbi:MAG: dCTP deaminase [Candidatus Altiarchaeota archaeon]
MILGKSEILKRVGEDALISNFSEEGLGGAGYDLRVARAYTITTHSFLGVSERKTPKVAELTDESMIIRPKSFILIETLEEVNMPEDVMARILPRSSLFRMGCVLATAVVDPGYKGTLTMGLANLSSHDFVFEKNARIAQIVFEEVKGETELYDGKYQGGKVV